MTGPPGATFSSTDNPSASTRSAATATSRQLRRTHDDLIGRCPADGHVRRYGQSFRNLDRWFIRSQRQDRRVLPERDRVGNATTNGSGVASLSGVSLSGINAGTYPTGVTVIRWQFHYASSRRKRTLTVNKAAGSVTINNIPASATYGGSFTPTFTKLGDGTASAASLTTGTCTISAGVVSYVGAGTCSLQASVTAGTDHLAATGASQSFTIGKKPLTVTATNASKTYGAANPAFAFTYSGGFVGTDTAAGIDTPPTLHLDGDHDHPGRDRPDHLLGRRGQQLQLHLRGGHPHDQRRQLTITADRRRPRPTATRSPSQAPSSPTARPGQPRHGRQRHASTSAGAAATATVAGSPYAIVAERRPSARASATTTSPTSTAALTVDAKAADDHRRPTRPRPTATGHLRGHRVRRLGAAWSTATRSTASRSPAPARRPPRPSRQPVRHHRQRGRRHGPRQLRHHLRRRRADGRRQGPDDHRRRPDQDLRRRRSPSPAPSSRPCGLVNGDTVDSVTLTSAGAAATRASPAARTPIVASGGRRHRASATTASPTSMAR